MPRFGERHVEKDGETLELQEARVKQHYTEGMRLLMQGKKEEARSRFQRTLTDPAFGRDIVGNARFSSLRKVRGLCFKQLSQIAKEQGDKATAMQMLGDALALDDSDVVMWHDLGCLALNFGRLNVARCAFERGLEMRPHHPLFLDRLCEVTYRIGDFDACHCAADLLLTLAPAHPRGLVFKGLLLCQHPVTEEEGRELLEDAQAADGALSPSEVEELRNLDRKRPRREPAPKAAPRIITLAQPNWRCMLENVVPMLSSTPQQQAESAPCSHTNQLCVFSLESSPAKQQGTMVDATQASAERDGPARGDQETSHGSRDPDMIGGGDVGGDMEASGEVLHEEADAQCEICGGDVDPGDHPGDDLLLCENFEKCGMSYHTTCLSPPLKQPPGEDEEWFCFKCQPRPQDDGREPSADTGTAATALVCETGVECTSGSARQGAEEAVSPLKEAASPSKRRRSRTANSEPSRKSGRRQLQADADKRPQIAMQLGRILDLVTQAVADEGAEDDDFPSPRPLPESALSAPKRVEDKGETLSRYEMVQRMRAVGAALNTAHEPAIAKLLADFGAQPTCLMEIMHKLVHALGVVACQVRLRGKALDMALQLDAVARERLTYAPEVSLFFAELNLDRYEACLKDSARRQREQECASNGESSASLVAAAGNDEHDDEHGKADENKTDPNSYRKCLAAYEFHVKGLWCQRFNGWREQARYLWLLARHALCENQPWNALESLEMCRAVFNAAHADAAAAAAAVIYLPSCQLNNCITRDGLGRCILQPQQDVRALMLDQQAHDLAAAMQVAQATATDKQGQDDEQEAQQHLKSVAARTVRTLSPFLIRDAEQNDWLVKTLSSADKESWQRTEKHLDQLRNACSELPECFKQEVYVFNVLLAEVVRVKNILTERRDNSLFSPVDPRLLSKGENAPLFGAEPTLNIVSDMIRREKERLAELCTEDKHVPKILHQLEVQVARLTCKLGCNRDHAPLFHKSLLLFYKIYVSLRPQLKYQEKAEVLQIMLEELLRRNVHRERSNSFFRTYLLVLHEQRRRLEGERVASCASNHPEIDKEQADTNVSAESDDEEMYAVMQALARCYYAMLGLKLREFRSEYEWVDNLMRSYLDEGESSDARRTSKSKECNESKSLQLTERDSALALDLWEFVKPLATPQGGGKFKSVAAADLKDVVNVILGALERCVRPEIFAYKKDLDKFLLPFCDTSPTLEDLLPDFAAVLANLPVPSVARYLESVSQHMSEAKKANERRMYECLKEIYFLSAECLPLRNEEEIRQKVDLYLYDLRINPWRKESWVALADSYDELLQVSSQSGIRFNALLGQSKDAQILLCNCLQAYSAVLAVSTDDAATTQDARKRLGVMLYLLIQGTRKLENPYPGDWYRQVCARAYGLFKEAHDPEDWTIEYYQGKLARKLALSQTSEHADECVRRHKESLEHFYVSAVQNVEEETSTLCIESLYKLHSTRAKLILSTDCSNEMRELLDSYSLTRCVERAKKENGGTLPDKGNLNVTKGISKSDCAVTLLSKAEKEQSDFEAAVQLRAEDGVVRQDAAEGGDSKSLHVLRDCMLAMRIAIKKNSKFWSSKTRFRLAWMIEQSSFKYLNLKEDEVQTAVSKSVNELLQPLFFSEKDAMLPRDAIEGKFSNYIENSPDFNVASFNNLNMFMRNKTKLIKLFVTHLCSLRNDETLGALERVGKLLGFLIKEEKVRCSNKEDANPHSFKVAIHHTVKCLFGAMQNKLLGQHRKDNENCKCDHSKYPLQISQDCPILVQGKSQDSAEFEFVFWTAGKLRNLLQDHMDLFNYLKVDVDARLRRDLAWQGQLQTPPEEKITLRNRACPLINLLHSACTAYCHNKGVIYFETAQNDDGQKCMGCAMARWKEAFDQKKTSLQVRGEEPKAVVSASTTLEVTESIDAPLAGTEVDDGADDGGAAIVIE